MRGYGGDHIGEAEKNLFAGVARVILSGTRGDLASQLELPYPEPQWRREPPPLRLRPAPASEIVEIPVPALTFANGIGGFADLGREYVVVLDGDQETPLPWVNVMANPGFGTVVSAAGSHRPRAQPYPRRNPPASDQPGWFAPPGTASSGAPAPKRRCACH